MVQSITPDALRGRVMGIYTLSFFGVIPIGALIAGQVAEIIGEAPTILIGVVSLITTALFIFWRVPELRKME